MHELLKEFRAAAAQHFAGGPRRGRCYPQALRDRAVQYAEMMSVRGVRAADVAKQLGVDPSTLWAWRRGAVRPQQAALTRVHVVEPEALPFSETRVVVHARGGLRIEGLSVGDLAALIRQL